jgi:hypothetical protein
MSGAQVKAVRLVVAVAVVGTIGLATVSPAPAVNGHASRAAAQPNQVATAALAPTSVILGQTSGVAPIGCATTYSGVQTTVAGPPSYVTPFAGVITSFSHRSDADPGQIRALVYVPTSPNTYQVLAKSAVETIAADVLNTFQTRLAVPAGALLGSQMFSGSMVCGFTTGVAGDAFKYGSFDPDTASVFTPVASFSGRWNVSAVLENDEDGDGFGDVSQDLCPQSKLTHAACPVPDTTVTKAPKKKSTKRRAKIVFSSTVAGSTFTCAVDKKAATPCTSPFKKKYKVGKHTVVITAISPVGFVDATPVTVKFKITKPRR